MEFGLVLGGGGVIGVAWETGFVQGCADAGVDLSRAKVIVGTSAGAMVGARLRIHGLAEPDDEDGKDGKGEIPGDVFSHVPQEATREVFKTWMKMTGPDARVARRIGELACQTDNDGESMVTMMRSRGEQWPAGDFRICAVSVQTGERAVFDRNSGVELARCIAASTSVPAIFAPVTIDGVRYIDGQVHSGTNGDVLVDEPLPLVLIAAPTCEVTAAGLGVAAEHCLRAEVARLEAAGKRVVQVLPQAQDKAAYGNSLMDGAHAQSAQEAGRAQGRAVAEAHLGELKVN